MHFKLPGPYKETRGRAIPKWLEQSYFQGRGGWQWVCVKENFSGGQKWIQEGLKVDLSSYFLNVSDS